MKVYPLLIVSALALGGCGPSAPWAPEAPSSNGQQGAAGDDGGYRPPPRLTKAARMADGQVVLSGLGLAGATVRLSSPHGETQEALIDGAGQWTLTVPAHAPAIYGVSQNADGRRDQAQGYVLVLPGAGPAAAELRSGAGVRTLPPEPLGVLRLDAVDVDASGAAVVSGWTGASQPIHVMLDGAPVDEGAASAAGRFSLALPKPLTAGTHTVQIAAQGAAAQAKMEATPPAPFSGALHAVPYGSGWRVDWLTPAGGEQTTFLFTPDGAKS